MNELVNSEIDRCGYEVSENLLKIWKIELEMAQKILEICNKYNIEIFAWAGTMLGAVRHKGFIPWDDDFDFIMTRDNFNKLIEVENEFKYPFFLQHALNDRRFFCDYARLRNSETTGIITWNKSNEYNNGIYVDIYILDGMPSNAVQLNFFFLRKKFLRKIFHCFYLENIMKDHGRVNLVNMLFHLIASLKRYEEWYKIYCNLLSGYSKKCTQMTMLTHEKKVIHKYWCYKRNIEKLINVEFENIKIPIMVDYNEALTNMYGDYMKFTPVEERGKWHNNQIIFNPDISYKKYFETVREENENS